MKPIKRQRKADTRCSTAPKQCIMHLQWKCRLNPHSRKENSYFLFFITLNQSAHCHIQCSITIAWIQHITSRTLESFLNRGTAIVEVPAELTFSRIISEAAQSKLSNKRNPHPFRPQQNGALASTTSASPVENTLLFENSQIDFHSDPIHTYSIFVNSSLPPHHSNLVTIKQDRPNAPSDSVCLCQINTIASGREMKIFSSSIRRVKFTLATVCLFSQHKIHTALCELFAEPTTRSLITQLAAIYAIHSEIYSK